MINLDDIHRHKTADNAGKQRLEKKFQEDELGYLASMAAEEFSISQTEIDALSKRIDASVPRSGPTNAIFISLLCGLLIGMSLFFVFFQKSKNHPGISSLFAENAGSPKSLNNTVTENDTAFAAPAAEEKPYSQEHFASIHEEASVEPTPAIMPEALESHKVTVSGLSKSDDSEDLALKFVPNAPLMFIHDLKVTNYRLYYFKNDHRIDLSANSGVPAQYSDQDDKSNLPNETESFYYAHQQLKDAMLEFSRSHYAACIYNLQDLLKLNATDANALFYSGMSYYYLMNDDKAIGFFNKVLDSENNIFHQEAEFYKAQCLLRSKQTDEAILLLKQIEKQKGFYSARATELLNPGNTK